jgi:type I restriction enzyme S subunit
MMAATKNTKAFYKTEIPSNWEVKKLGECCLVKGEYGINASAVEFSDELPAYLRITDIDNDGNYSSIKKTSVGDPNYEQFILKDGDIVFARTGATVGKTYLYKSKDGILVFAGFLIRFRTNEKILMVNHLKYFTESKLYWDWVKTVSMRSGQPGINAEEYSSLKIPLPPLPEQKAIAQVLSTADAAIHTTEKLISQKILRKKWLMQQLLTGKKRLMGFEDTKWKIQPLENFIKPIVREVPKPSTPYLGIGLRSHGKGTFLKHDEQPEKNSMDNFYVVRQNDLIVNITFAWEQAIAIVRPEDDGALASHRFPTYTFIEDKGHPEFFRFYILKPRMKSMLQIISPGGAGRNRVMSKSDFIKLEFLLPEYEEQTAIAQVLQAADREISLLKAKAEKLREQKKGLMQVLLTGKIRLNYDSSDFYDGHD